MLPPALCMVMRVEIWSDVVCPWCYVGKRRFEQALAGSTAQGDVEIHWRSFELDPSAPRERTGSYVERLAEKYGTDVPAAQAMIEGMTANAAAEGLDFRFDLARAGNTFDAHRLLHLAAEHGLQDALKERLLRATFTEGAPIGEVETLVGLGAEVGLDADEARAVLTGDRFAEQVRADEAQAVAYGISGVPFFVVDGRYGVSGAQPAEALREVLDRAYAESRPLTMVAAGSSGAPGCEGASCEGDSCAV